MNRDEKKQKITAKTISKEVKDIIKLLKSSKIKCFKIPEEYQNDKNIIKVERELGIRKLGRRGFDIIRNTFFVEEELNTGIRIKTIITNFDDFEEYVDFLDGEIYDNACYYQCDISKIKSKVNFDRFNERNYFVEDTIDDASLPIDEERLLYDKGEQIKQQCKNWIARFNSCMTADEFQTVYRKSLSYELGTTSDREYKDFFLWQYIFSALNDKRKFDILMEYMSGCTCANSLVREMCVVFNPDDVMAGYKFTGSSKPSMYKQKKRLADIVLAVKNGLIDKEVLAYFDEINHYYCEKCTYILREEQTCISEGMNEFSTYRYFDTFDEFIKYRKGDLTHCDLSKAIKLDYDFTKCKMDDTTMLPYGGLNNVNYIVRKEYSDEKFIVIQEWYNFYGILVKNDIRKFDYFFDFVAFLKGDLSNADLLLCNGLRNLRDVSGLNLNNIKATSEIYEKLGIQYELCKIDNDKIESFTYTEENEKNTELMLQASRESAILGKTNGVNSPEKRIYYVSDIHLLHKIRDFESKSKDDVIYVIRSIVKNIVKESGNIILIGGDVSSDFSVFDLFIRILRSELDNKKPNTTVIFVLGNHELWDFSHYSFKEIVMKYRNLINECKMYLLQNNILYMDSEQVVHEITAMEIISLENKQLYEKIRTSRITFFGGLAFSGCNENFNANHGIYRNTIDRDTEKEESEKFEELYKKVRSIFLDRNLIVFTHMPMDCWSQSVDYHKNFIYVSGHTHKNYFYDDGDIHVYADNQIGYKNNQTHVKWFEIDNEYDYFENYRDGIHEITKYDYQEFCRGKNIMINFSREINILYMLKKNGYYCFIHKSKGGSYTILNGGALKQLDRKDINYYYENMDSVVELIKKPLGEYTKIQEIISNEIREIGGSGYIHGCIVDIDYYNHVYVNPVDMKVTGYWALDITFKKVYPTIPELLKNNCPSLYANYIKLLKENSKNWSVFEKSESSKLTLLPQVYLDTDIYKASREIKKMQKINSSNILTIWYEVDKQIKLQ